MIVPKTPMRLSYFFKGFYFSNMPPKGEQKVHGFIRDLDRAFLHFNRGTVEFSVVSNAFFTSDIVCEQGTLCPAVGYGVLKNTSNKMEMFPNLFVHHVSNSARFENNEGIEIAQFRATSSPPTITDTRNFSIVKVIENVQSGNFSEAVSDKKDNGVMAMDEKRNVSGVSEKEITENEHELNSVVDEAVINEFHGSSVDSLEERRYLVKPYGKMLGVPVFPFEDGVSDDFFINVKGNTVTFKIQEGARKEVGFNGCQIDDMVIFVRKTLEWLNAQASCRENSLAITKLQEAEMWLRERTFRRWKEGKEGTSE